MLTWQCGQVDDLRRHLSILHIMNCCAHQVLL